MALRGAGTATRPYAARRCARTDPCGRTESKARISTFVLRLRELGWVDGSNVEIVYRWSGGNVADTRKYAAELAALAPDVILTFGSLGAGALLQATRTVPAVFAMVPDPVGSGFVKSLSRPGGNTTGFMMFEYSLCAKWLELLKEIAPSVTRAAVLWDPQPNCRDRPVRCNPVRCVVGSSRSEPSQHK
jgi:putative ABC transport system substrate-binding protein